MEIMVNKCNEALRVKGISLLFPSEIQMRPLPLVFSSMPCVSCLLFVLKKKRSKLYIVAVIAKLRVPWTDGSPGGVHK